MTPYLRQRGPPALVTMLPPIDIVGAAGRVGRIEQALLLDRLLQLLGVDAGLDDGDEVGGVDFLDAVHALQRKHDAAVHGHAAADVAVAGAARRDRNAVAVGEAQDGGDGLGAARQGDGVGPVRGEPFVAGMFGQDGGCETDFARRQDAFQLGEELNLAWGSSGGVSAARNSLASAASSSGTCTRMPPAASA